MQLKILEANCFFVVSVVQKAFTLFREVDQGCEDMFVIFSSKRPQVFTDAKQKLWFNAETSEIRQNQPFSKFQKWIDRQFTFGKLQKTWTESFPRWKAEEASLFHPSRKVIFTQQDEGAVRRGFPNEETFPLWGRTAKFNTQVFLTMLLEELHLTCGSKTLTSVAKELVSFCQKSCKPILACSCFVLPECRVCSVSTRQKPVRQNLRNLKEMTLKMFELCGWHFCPVSAWKKSNANFAVWSASRDAHVNT